MISALNRLLKNESLSRAEAFRVMELLTGGTVVPEQAGAFLAALRLKSETVDEIVGFVESLRSHALPLPSLRQDLVDVCGTGGDGLGTFNVSTTVSFVLAAGGLGVAKHGNRSVSSKSGSFDVLEALGLKFSSDIEKIKDNLEKFNLGFLFAPAFHPALKNLADLRRKLGVYTVFNLLGPLLNPIHVKRQVIGVYNKEALEKLTLASMALGSEEVMVVHGHDGLDEITISAPTEISHFKEGQMRRYTLRPEDCHLKTANLSEVKGGSALENAQILKNILAGDQGPKTDLVLINAAAAFIVGGRAPNFPNGVNLAREAIASGKALKILEAMQAEP